jgi:hypothetical protein
VSDEDKQDSEKENLSQFKSFAMERKREERRILSSPAKQGESVTRHLPLASQLITPTPPKARFALFIYVS